MFRNITRRFLSNQPQPAEEVVPAAQQQAEPPAQVQPPGDVRRKISQFVFEGNPLGRGVAQLATSARGAAEEAAQAARTRKEQLVLGANQAADGLKEKVGNATLRLAQKTSLGQLILERSHSNYNRELADEIQRFSELLYPNDGNPANPHRTQTNLVNLASRITMEQDFISLCEHRLKALQPRQAVMQPEPAIHYPTKEIWNPAIHHALTSWFFSIYIQNKIEDKMQTVPEESLDFTDLRLEGISLKESYPHLFPSLAKAFNHYNDFFSVLSQEQTLADNHPQKGVPTLTFAQQLAQKGLIEAAIGIRNQFMTNANHIAELNRAIGAAEQNQRNGIAVEEEKKEQ